MLWSSWGVHGVPGSWILPSNKTVVVVVVVAAVSSGGNGRGVLSFFVLWLLRRFFELMHEFDGQC